MEYYLISGTSTKISNGKPVTSTIYLASTGKSKDRRILYWTYSFVDAKFFTSEDRATKFYLENIHIIPKRHNSDPDMITLIKMTISEDVIKVPLIREEDENDPEMKMDDFTEMFKRHGWGIVTLEQTSSPNYIAYNDKYCIPYSPGEIAIAVSYSIDDMNNIIKEWRDYYNSITVPCCIGSFVIIDHIQYHKFQHIGDVAGHEYTLSDIEKIIVDMENTETIQ